jgi:O-antigen ligase
MKILSAENSYVRLFIQYSLPFLVIGIISRTFPITSPVYYIVPVLLILNIILAFILIPRTDKTLTYIFIILVFPAYCLVTSIWSLYPTISIQRSLYLLLMYAGILSSVFLYKKFYSYKELGFLIPANILILVLSVISLIFSIPVDSWTGGNGLGFMGFAGHQNTLAAAILFTFPGIVAKGLEQSAKRLGQSAKGKASSVFRLSSYFLLLTFDFSLLVITYSRAAILAFAIGIITYLIITKSKKVLSFLFSIIVLVLVLYFTIPVIQNSIHGVLNKDGGNILDRRTVLWEPSLEAAKLGGIFGLGYGVSAPDIKTPISTGSHYEDRRYVREKGNSVLAMVEETGLIGLMLFLLPIILLIRKFSMLNAQSSIKEKLKNNYSFLILNSSLAALLLHSQFEAWWVGVGSITLPLYLIFLFMTLLQEKS